MNADVLDSRAIGSAKERVNVRFVTVHVAVGKQPEQVQRAALHAAFLDRLPHRRAKNLAGLDGAVHQARALVENAGTTQPVRVISEETWPLPWYLRGLPNVGYWTTVPDECDGLLVIASAGLADQVQARLRGTYTTSFVGLRPGFTLVVFKRQP